MLKCIFNDINKVNEGWLKFARSSEEKQTKKKIFPQFCMDIQYTIMLLEQFDFMMKDLLKE